MKQASLVGALLTASLVLSMSAATAAAAAVDADAATGLAKSNGCMKCHAVDKAKKGPSYKKIAEKYKGKADAESAIVKSITTGPKIKLDDGSEDQHKVIDTKDQGKLKNLVNWILTQ